MNTPGQNSNAVAELAMGMMVFMARGQFKGISGTELKGKKLGLHAYGYVGKAVATIAKGFGMDVYAFDPFLKEEEISKEGDSFLSIIMPYYGQKVTPSKLKGAELGLEEEFGVESAIK